MTIEYVNSEEVQTSSQLDEIFHKKCGVMIDGRIYTSIDSIIEVSHLNYRYEVICNYLHNNCPEIKFYKYPIDSDNKVKTLEFIRITMLANSIYFSNLKL